METLYATLYAEEKFADAEEQLVFGTGNIKDRVRNAYSCFHVVSANDLPDDLKKDFQLVLKMLKRKAPLKAKFSENIISSDVDQTLHRMHLKTAQKIAYKIVGIRRGLKYHNDEIYRS